MKEEQEKRQRILSKLFPKLENEPSSPFEIDVESGSFRGFDQVGDKKLCPICLETTRKIEIIPPCDHKFFHYDCLMHWMVKGHNECPQCRKKLYDTSKFQALEKEEDDDVRTENGCLGRRENTGLFVALFVVIIIGVITGRAYYGRMNDDDKRPERRPYSLGSYAFTPNQIPSLAPSVVPTVTPSLSPTLSPSS